MATPLLQLSVQLAIALTSLTCGTAYRFKMEEVLAHPHEVDAVAPEAKPTAEKPSLLETEVGAQVDTETGASCFESGHCARYFVSYKEPQDPAEDPVAQVTTDKRFSANRFSMTFDGCQTYQKPPKAETDSPVARSSGKTGEGYATEFHKTNGLIGGVIDESVFSYWVSEGGKATSKNEIGRYILKHIYRVKADSLPDAATMNAGDLTAMIKTNEEIDFSSDDKSKLHSGWKVYDPRSSEHRMAYQSAADLVKLLTPTAEAKHVIVDLMPELASIAKAGAMDDNSAPPRAFASCDSLPPRIK